jgi:hypothetical protein
VSRAGRRNLACYFDKVGRGWVSFSFLSIFLGEISYSILMTWTGIFFMLYASSQVLIMMTAANAEESRSVSLVT